MSDQNPPGQPPSRGPDDPYGDQPPERDQPTEYGQQPYGDRPPEYGQQPYGDRPPEYGQQPYRGPAPYGGQQPPHQDPHTRQGGFQPYPGGPAAARSDAKGFFGALFDFSFASFVTPKIVKFVYILATIVLALVWVVWVIVGFADSLGYGLAALLLGWIPALLYLALIRMTLEFYYAIVRMSQDINQRLPR